jgi:hypothetical protein
VNVQDASEREHAQAEPVVPPSRQLMNMVVGMWWSRAVSVAAELGVADIGGGRGTLLGGLVAAYPRLRGLLVERPEVIAQVRAAGTEGHPDERISLISRRLLRRRPARGCVPPAQGHP